MKRLVCILCLMALLCGCGAAQPSYDERSIYAMDTYMTIRVYGDDGVKLAADTVQRINELNAMLSATDSSSPLFLLNAGGSAQCPDELCDLLTKTVALSRRTAGALDPTVFPLMQLWGFPEKDYRVPTPAELAAALAGVGVEHIQIDGSTVTLTDGARLDFGAVAKGYAGQTCADALLAGGADAALLSLGGNVQTVGTKPDGSPWVIGITDPQAPDAVLATLSLTGTHAIVTSGSYQRCFEKGGVRYHHILDPATGAPADNGLVSVTVVADDGFLADGLSTALFVMGLEDAAAFYRRSDDFEAVFVSEDGTVYVTEGLTCAISGTDYMEISK